MEAKEAELTKLKAHNPRLLARLSAAEAAAAEAAAAAAAAAPSAAAGSARGFTRRLWRTTPAWPRRAEEAVSPAVGDLADADASIQRPPAAPAAAARCSAVWRRRAN